MNNVRMGRDPRPIPTSFQNLRTARSESPEKRTSERGNEPRSRSLSPVKKSPTTFGLSSHLADTTNPTTAMTRDQLILLSRTPLSNTLHISRNDYAIPIPFKLQMPPKLARPTSANANSSLSLPGHHVCRNLIFNGTDYELLDHDSSVSTVPSTPQKPPSTVANRKKMARFVQKSSTMPSDQLSLIEEKSANGGSRIPSKRLPSLPHAEVASEASSGSIINAGNAESLVLAHERDNENSQTLTRDESIDKPQPPPRLVSSAFFNIKKLDSPQPRSGSEITPEKTVIRERIGSGNPNNARNTPASESRSAFPSSTTFHHNMYMAPSELKIGKRTFSDESCISSVSSFSSVGDILNFNHAYMSRPNEKGEVRVTSDVLNYLETGKLSRHGSLMAPKPKRSVADDCKEQDIFSSKDANEAQSLSGLPFADGKSHNVIRKSQTEPALQSVSHDTVGSVLSQLEESPEKSPNETSSVSISTEPLVIQNKSIRSLQDLDTSQDSAASSTRNSSTEYNNGAGVQFNFPNDGSNATNGDKARRKAQNQKAYKKSTSFSSHFSNGQIEIPELLETVPMTTKDSASEIEPLGVPSAAAVSHLKGLYGESSFDTDSEGSFNSQFHVLQAKQVSKPPHVAASKSHNVIPSSNHPLKNSHSRHRSMYNIDFDHQDFASISPLKTRPMSMNFEHEAAETSKQIESLKLSEDGAIQNSVGPYSTFKTPIKINSSKVVLSPVEIPQNEHQNDLEIEEPMNINVAEAPKKVSYPVDFKDQGSKNEPNSFEGRTRPTFYHEISSKKYPASRGFDSQSKSDAASSYKSSRTGQYTESTAPTDNNSVVIDLTKESYDICMINRNDSTTSYKSVTEKMRNGKKVEVVLVEEDDDILGRSYERDDLSSIYSHYMSDWDDVNRSFRLKEQGVSDISSYVQKQSLSKSTRRATKLGPHGHSQKLEMNQLSAANLSQLHIPTRKQSTGSVESENSDASANSWMPSESNFRVKSGVHEVEKHKTHLKSTFASNKEDFCEPPLSIKNVSMKRKSQEPVMLRHSDHFDYHENGNYDFNSFMLQSKH